MTDNKEKMGHRWAMLCHMAALISFIGVPFGHIIGPLLVWLFKKGDHEFVDRQGKEALNFQISWTIYGLVAALLVVAGIGIALLIALAIANFVLVVLAAVRASSGQEHRYPITIRFIK